MENGCDVMQGDTRCLMQCPCPCIVQSVGPLFGLMSVDSTTNVNPGSLTFPRITMISTTNVGRIHDTS